MTSDPEQLQKSGGALDRNSAVAPLCLAARALGKKVLAEAAERAMRARATPERSADAGTDWRERVVGAIRFEVSEVNGAVKPSVW